MFDAWGRPCPPEDTRLQASTLDKNALLVTTDQPRDGNPVELGHPAVLSSESKTSDNPVYDDRCWPPWALPNVPNVDGRPVWEPPIMDYSSLIGEEHEKKRDAMMKYTGDDVAKTTEIMDALTEYELLEAYTLWVSDNAGRFAASDESRKFFQALQFELRTEWWVVFGEWGLLDGGLIFAKNEDGTYRVEPHVKPTATARVVENSLSASEDTAIESKAHTFNIASTQANGAIDLKLSSVLSDEDDARSCITCSDSDGNDSHPSGINTIQHENSGPLALRLISLLSSSYIERTVEERGGEDDLD